MKWFNKPKQKNTITPAERGFYMFNTERAGDGLIFVEQQYKSYKFLYIPGAETFYLSTEDFEKSIKCNVLTFIEQLPEDIFQESLMLSSPSEKQTVYSNEKQNNQRH